MKNAIFDVENWREIVATLARNKTRTFLTAFGIFWGTAMLAMLWGGANGLEGIMSRQFAGFATNTGAVFSNRTSMPYKGFSKGMVWELDSRDLENIRRLVPEIEMSSPVNSRSVTAVHSDKSKMCRIIGVEPDYNRILIPTLIEGRLINESDVANARKVAVIGKNVAFELFGAESPLGRYVSLNNVYYRIIGVASQKSEINIAGRIDDGFLLPETTMARTFYGGKNTYGFIIYTVKHGVKPASLNSTIRRVVSLNHPVSPSDEQAVQFMDISEMFEMIDSLFLGLAILALFVGAGSLMAGIIGVGNIMWIIVKERTTEIGIRRAIGATPTDIIVQILSESVVLTLVAGVAGVCFAVLVLAGADFLTADPALGKAGFEIPFSSAVGIVVTFFVLGTLAGTLPAVKAMKIKPVEAMRDK